jgi:hypothetical protein
MIAKPFNVTIPNQRLWTFDDPFLYDVRVRILRTPSTSSFGLSLRKALPVVQQVRQVSKHRTLAFTQLTEPL